MAVQPTAGDHPWDQHVKSINTFEPETYCVTRNEAGGDFDWNDAFVAILGTLQTDNPAADWNFLGAGETIPVKNLQLYFNPIGNCDDLSPTAKNIVRLQYEVKENTQSVCGTPEPGSGIDGFSCVEGQETSSVDLHGHTVYAKYVLTIKRTHISGTVEFRHHLLNHETGHVLGLADPPPCEPDSVMHEETYYDCSEDWEWPTANDFDSVLSLIDDTGTMQYAGSCGRGPLTSNC